MKINTRNWWGLIVIGSIFCIGADRLGAEEQKSLPKGMTPVKLEKSVNKTLSYIDKRLLSGKNAEKIEQSGNDKAVALLQSSRKERGEIGEQIKQGQFEAAYWALKELNKSLKMAMQLTRAKAQAAKKAKNDLESARTISDAYHERAMQRGIAKGEGGEEARTLFKQVEKIRTKAQSAEANNNYQSAIEAYKSTTIQLMKAIAIARKQSDGKPTAKIQSKAITVAQLTKERVLPKGMTPKKLEKSVLKTLTYIDKRLLSGKNAEKIEQSGNDEAVVLLQDSRKERGNIEKQVKQGQFEAAYWALKELNKSLKIAMQLTRAKVQAAKKAKNDLESARTISDAYHERATQRGIGKGEGGEKALSFFARAEKARTKAQSSEADNNYKSAIATYKSSIRQLKKAITAARKQDNGKSIATAPPEIVAETPPEKKQVLPKGMTPEKLEKSVLKTLNYMDQRLLSGKNAKKIEQSGNDKAVALLQSSQKERKKIGEQIKEGQFEAAYWALKELNKSLKEAMKLTRAKDRAAKAIKAELESARTISDAYHERAKQRGINKSDNREALLLFQQAETSRTKAQSAEIAKDYKSAITAYKSATKRLKKAIAGTRKK